MNYQHAFHAGNFADVHKHIVLTRVLDYLRQKPAAFRVVDTHAGAGRYDLLGSQATRSGEWRDGIGRLFAMPQSSAAATDPAQALFAPYLGIVAALNPDETLRLYPGSPLIIKALLRRQDRLIACELEPNAAASLKAVLHGDARAKMLAIDGWMALFANIPPKERRGLIVIDPPYEESIEFARLCETLAQAYRKWANGLYLLWYPIKAREAPDALARRLQRLSVPKILRCELTIAPPRADGGLVGSGLIIVNPPFPLERELRVILPMLTRILAPRGAHHLDWLSE
ncbi:MAG: 23S rRNA (adenine(2030)-N(6))-methyltransferase RlmJ [Rhizobiales bacterium]|nr:23S rRNA (adenine(2030)-N(6))-methyltransferase RlmJ [Hyphomicrobiales bacterium]